jgi:hypothetical protein
VPKRTPRCFLAVQQRSGRAHVSSASTERQVLHRSALPNLQPRTQFELEISSFRLPSQERSFKIAAIGGESRVPVAALFRNAAVEPAVVLVMGDAFQRACRSLHDTGQPEIVQEVLAQRIIQLAEEGERDPRELCEKALRALGIESECE